MKMLNIIKKTFILIVLSICCIVLISCEEEPQELEPISKIHLPEYLKEIKAKIVENNPNGFEIDNKWFRFYRYTTKMRYGLITYSDRYELVGLGKSIGDEIGSISQFYAKNIQTSYAYKNRYAKEIVYEQIAKSYFKGYSYYCFYTESRYSSISDKLEIAREKSIGNSKIKDTEYLDFKISFLDARLDKNCDEVIDDYEFYTDLYSDGLFSEGPQTLVIRLEGGRINFSYTYDENYRITKIIIAETIFSRLGANGEFNSSSYYTCIELISPEKIQVPTEYDEEYIYKDGEDKNLYRLPLKLNYIT